MADYGSLACLHSQLAQIDQARASEGLGPMVLPGWYPKLTVPEQLLVVAGLEREARGLPIFVGLSASLDAMARKGALADEDPVGGPPWAPGAVTGQAAPRLPWIPTLSECTTTAR